ncbi:MAG TPA: carbon-nitrogen hydrolase [Candidatus Binataceae bacterium]|nr:carbon-nitrogen hydrolase [Candidatus Binataceae bacterium]
MAQTGNKVAIGLVQMRCAEKPRANLAEAIAKIEDAAKSGASIVSTQELFLSHYPCQTEDPKYFDLAEPIPGPTTNALCKIAKARKIAIVASIFERRAAGVYHNTAVVIDETGKIAGRYRKMHIPDDPRFYEKYYFTPGDLGFAAHRTARAIVGALVCWDQWFPEAARLVAMAGAQILFYPTAIGWWHGEPKSVRPLQREAWETIQRSHAIANGVFVAAINRVGIEGDLEFWGDSFVADPFGHIIARASGKSEETLIVECDLSQVEQVRRNWPFLRDRRIDAYGDLVHRYRS